MPGRTFSQCQTGGGGGGGGRGPPIGLRPALTCVFTFMVIAPERESAQGDYLSRVTHRLAPASARSSPEASHTFLLHDTRCTSRPRGARSARGPAVRPDKAKTVPGCPGYGHLHVKNATCVQHTKHLCSFRSCTTCCIFAACTSSKALEGKTAVSNGHAVAHTTAGAPPAASAHPNWIHSVSERIQAPGAGSRTLRSRTCWLRRRGMGLS
jgi:hypothetical protein